MERNLTKAVAQSRSDLGVFRFLVIPRIILPIVSIVLVVVGKMD